MQKPQDSLASGSRSGDQTSPASKQHRPQADVFVVDDEEGICKFVAMTIQGLGLRAESYHNAQDAIGALERGHPDMIFLDLALEGSDAVEMLRVLGDKRYGGVIQLMSGSSPGLLGDVRRIGARHGLQMREPLEKPFRGDAVQRAVTSAQLESPRERASPRAPAIKVGLQDALDNGWLELWYQPKIDLRSRALVGAEGLIRCRHPDHGLLAPRTFLPQASEESLLALTHVVVLAALRDWQELAEAGTSLRIAVNASAGALANATLAALIRENRPKRADWPGLILEVPEGEVVKDVPLFHEVATQLRIYGISLAIDDFGEGFSSFARLRELPFGELKLDRGFVAGCARDAKSGGMCRAVIALAHHFGVAAVAEGLEDIADAYVVRDMGCDIGQGYVFARPMPKASFLPLLCDRARRRPEWFA